MVEQQAAIDIGEGLLEFEARLARRTKVPPQRVDEILGWPDERLDGELDVVGRVVRRFAEAVVGSMEDPPSTNAFLQELDLKAISRDHDWRAVFSTMRAQEPGQEPFKRALLVRYLQYLSFRKRLLEFIRARRQGFEETDAYTEFTRPPGGPASDTDPFGRIALGETTTVPLGIGSALEVLLAAHRFRLVQGHPPVLMDQNGVTYLLREGRNMVGRHPESDITVDGNFRDVSRAHLILDWSAEKPGRVSFTDLSSRGTWLRRSVLDEVNPLA